MFSHVPGTVVYYGENKVGPCAEVLHDYMRCKRKAIDEEIECKLLLEDLEECRSRKKQKAALMKIKEAMNEVERMPLWKEILLRVLR